MRREHVALACERGHSLRRACELLGMGVDGIVKDAVDRFAPGP